MQAGRASFFGSGCNHTPPVSKLDLINIDGWCGERCFYIQDCRDMKSQLGRVVFPACKKVWHFAHRISVFSSHHGTGASTTALSKPTGSPGMVRRSMKMLFKDGV